MFNIELYNHVFASLLVGAVAGFIVTVGFSVLTDLNRRTIGLFAVVVFFVAACWTFGYAG